MCASSGSECSREGDEGGYLAADEANGSDSAPDLSDDPHDLVRWGLCLSGNVLK